MWKWIMMACLVTYTGLQAEVKVLALSGSTREDSANKKLVQEAASFARQMGASVTVIDLKNFPMPLYDADVEENRGLPENAKRLRKMMIDSQVIFIASPEYNGSVTAVLKNTLDWASRGENKQGSSEAFKGKKFVLMSASPSRMGGARGLVHLQNIIENIGGSVLSPQVTVPDAYNAFDSAGRLKDPDLKTKLRDLVKQAVH